MKRNDEINIFVELIFLQVCSKETILFGAARRRLCKRQRALSTTRSSTPITSRRPPSATVTERASSKQATPAISGFTSAGRRRAHADLDRTDLFNETNSSNADQSVLWVLGEKTTGVHTLLTRIWRKKDTAQRIAFQTGSQISNITMYRNEAHRSNVKARMGKITNQSRRRHEDGMKEDSFWRIHCILILFKIIKKTSQTAIFTT